MDVTECGGLLESCAAREGVDFIHDPNIGTTLAGQVTKRLKLMPMQDGKGMFISLVVSDRVAGAPVTFSVPVTWAEMRVIACLTEYCIPRLLAFDCLWSNNAQQQPQQGGGGGEYLPPSSSAMY